MNVSQSLFEKLPFLPLLVIDGGGVAVSASDRSFVLEVPFEDRRMVRGEASAFGFFVELNSLNVIRSNGGG